MLGMIPSILVTCLRLLKV